MRNRLNFPRLPCGHRGSARTNQGAARRTVDERGVGSEQRLEAAGAGQDVHPEPSVPLLQRFVLRRHQRRSDRAAVGTQHLGPPLLGCGGTRQTSEELRVEPQGC